MQVYNTFKAIMNTINTLLAKVHHLLQITINVILFNTKIYRH